MTTNKNKVYLIIGSVLVLLLIGVTTLLVSEKKANRELTQEFELEKEDLENQYTTFAKQYDELKLTVSNDSLSVLLEQEQRKTQRLLEELRTVKSTNASEIRRLRNELASLRKVMIGYINQIDSLNRLTAQQREIIADVTEKYNTASATISNLSQEKQALNQKVTLAAQLDATAIEVTPLNKRSKKTKRIKNHHRRNRRTHALCPHHEAGQRRAVQECLGRLPLREPRVALLHPEIHRIQRRGATRHRLLGCGGIPLRRHLPRGHLRGRQPDRHGRLHTGVKILIFPRCPSNKSRAALFIGLNVIQ